MQELVSQQLLNLQPLLLLVRQTPFHCVDSGRTDAHRKLRRVVGLTVSPDRGLRDGLQGVVDLVGWVRYGVHLVQWTAGEVREGRIGVDHLIEDAAQRPYIRGVRELASARWSGPRIFQLTFKTF